jgi:Ni/Co efflux regulator RcnB
MKLSMLALAAALTLGGLAATAADAQRDRGDRTVVRTTRTVVMHRRTSAHQDWNRGRHRGWGNHQRTCRTTWRHGQRIRTCRSW